MFIIIKNNKLKPVLIILLSLIMTISMISCVSESNDSENQVTTVDTTESSKTTETSKEKKESSVKKENNKSEKAIVSPDDKYVSVKDTGAKGNGTADDTAAIQTALDLITDGGTVYFPSGTYRVTESLYVKKGNITICGNNKTTHIIYEYEQTENDNYNSASLFNFYPKINNVVFKDMKLEYIGEFFPEFGQSYDGVVNGLNFGSCYDVLVENVEISGFNASGIFVGAKNVAAYAKRIKINKSYLHHNRVAGVLYGYVDGISITNCDLNYNGSQPDGGTGYGCAGSSGAVPKNVQIIGNRANYNYRKGIDLHAGVQGIVEGNICKGNRLYGIYTEGRNTGDIIIRNNIITGMEKEALDIDKPYTWITGISVGVWKPGGDRGYHNYIISGNIIKDFGLDEGDAYPIFVYHSNNNGNIQIKDNTLILGNVSNIVAFSQRGKPWSNYDISLDISGNQATVFGNVKNNPFQIKQYSKLTMSFNQIVFKNPLDKYIVSVDNPGESQTIYTFNNITVPEYKKEEEINIDKEENKAYVKFKNFLNGDIS